MRLMGTVSVGCRSLRDRLAHKRKLSSGSELIGSYEGPDVVLDFDLRGVLACIEILA